MAGDVAHQHPLAPVRGHGGEQHVAVAAVHRGKDVAQLVGIEGLGLPQPGEDVLGQAALVHQPLVLLRQLAPRLGQGHMAADAGAHDGGTDRAADEIHGPQGQAPNLVADGGHGGDEDHGNGGGGRIGLEPVQHLVAVHARHHDVEQDQVRRRLVHRAGQGFRTVVGEAQVVFELQAVGQHFDVFPGVVHDEDDGAPGRPPRTPAAGGQPGAALVGRM